MEFLHILQNIHDFEVFSDIINLAKSLTEQSTRSENITEKMKMELEKKHGDHSASRSWISRPPATLDSAIRISRIA